MKKISLSILLATILVSGCNNFNDDKINALIENIEKICYVFDEEFDCRAEAKKHNNIEIVNSNQIRFYLFVNTCTQLKLESAQKQENGKIKIVFVEKDMPCEEGGNLWSVDLLLEGIEPIDENTLSQIEIYQYTEKYNEDPRKKYPE